MDSVSFSSIYNQVVTKNLTNSNYLRNPKSKILFDWLDCYKIIESNAIEDAASRSSLYDEKSLSANPSSSSSKKRSFLDLIPSKVLHNTLIRFMIVMYSLFMKILGWSEKWKPFN